MQSNLGRTRIEHTSITEKVSNWLRISIIKGDLKSGTKLTEQKVSKMLNVSTTPVREAFRTLEAENLLIHNPYSGVCVAEISPKYLVDICEMRRFLDIGSSDTIMENATEAHIEELYEIIDGLRNFDPMGIGMEKIDETERFINEEEKFHLGVARITGNMELENMEKILLKKAHVFRLMLVSTFPSTNQMELTLNELVRITEAIEKKDKKAFIDGVTEHYGRSESKNRELINLLKDYSGKNVLSD